MTAWLIYVITIGSCLLNSIILYIIVTKSLNKYNNIEITGTKLKNSKEDIREAVDYLEITNNL